MAMESSLVFASKAKGASVYRLATGSGIKPTTSGDIARVDSDTKGIPSVFARAWAISMSLTTRFRLRISSTASAVEIDSVLIAVP